MKRAAYPFSAIVGQEEMKLALLLAAVDWRIGVLLRGDKGAGKTTAARGLAELLPLPSPFINLPIGATEDRLLGGLNLERTLKGEPVLRPGLLSEAHGGVLYIDEINLLPAHLGDAILDAAASGVHTVEREGFSASHPAEFVLLGSMNPEEGTLRPQLLDRFALAVDIAAPADAATRRTVVEHRIDFERNASAFRSDWSDAERRISEQLKDARSLHPEVECSPGILVQISEAVCEAGVRSLRADLAVVRAAIAYAALIGDNAVRPDHVATVLPLALAHRRQDRARTPAPRSQPPAPKPDAPSDAADSQGKPETGNGEARIFAPKTLDTFALRPSFEDAARPGASTSTPFSNIGPVTRARRTETPQELDVRATVSQVLVETGSVQPRVADLYERVRSPKAGTRYLFVIDSSGSHAAQERMRLVKGAAASLLERSFKNGDEVAILAFRGTAAQAVLEPSNVVQDAIAALEYLPTGGRTPLAHGLDLARTYLTPSTVLILLTDGRANVPLDNGDPWQDALQIASQIQAASLVIDTENSNERLGRSLRLAEALGAECFRIDSPELSDSVVFALQRRPMSQQSRN